MSFSNLIKVIRMITKRETKEIEFDIISETKDGELIFTDCVNINWRADYKNYKDPKKEAEDFRKLKVITESSVIFLKCFETKQKIKYRLVSNEKLPENILNELIKLKILYHFKYDFDMIIVDKPG